MIAKKWLWVLLLPAVIFAGCEEGKLFAQFTWDSSVTEMTLTGLNVSVESSLPDPDTLYEIEMGEATLLWRTSGTLVALSVVVEPNPAETTEFLFFDVDVAEGEEKTLLFEFTGDQLTVSELAQTLTGAAF
jgi:hypothetical protein